MTWTHSLWPATWGVQLQNPCFCNSKASQSQRCCLLLTLDKPHDPHRFPQTVTTAENDRPDDICWDIGRGDVIGMWSVGDMRNGSYLREMLKKVRRPVLCFPFHSVFDHGFVFQRHSMFIQIPTLPHPTSFFQAAPPYFAPSFGVETERYRKQFHPKTAHVREWKWLCPQGAAIYFSSCPNL